MKTIKRIFAVILLILAVMAVCYLVFTGSRLPSHQEEPQTEAGYETSS